MKLFAAIVLDNKQLISKAVYTVSKFIKIKVESPN